MHMHTPATPTSCSRTYCCSTHRGQALNQERMEKLALRKQLGQSPPKKGQGKRASKKK